MDRKKQVAAGPVQRMNEKAFAESDTTVVRWLFNGGAIINSHGCIIMIDPLLKGFDMPLLIEPPLKTEEVTRLHAILITHSDNDHFSRQTCRELAPIFRSGIHTTKYVNELLQQEKIAGSAGYEIGDSFIVGNCKITLTPADHAWQNERPKYAFRYYHQNECCGFRIETAEGTIWMPGDSRLMEEQLMMPRPDVILLDISDSPWHIGLSGIKRLTAAYPAAALIPVHWGCVDAPTMAEFNGDPQVLNSFVVNPERIRILAPGEPFELK